MTRYASPREPELRARGRRHLLVDVVFAAMLVVSSEALSPRSESFSSIPVVTLLLLALFAWRSRGLAPRGYSVDADIRVERRGSPLVIPMWRVRTVAALPGPLAAETLRWAGGGGMGYAGRVTDERLGPLEIAATRRRDLVVLDTDRERFIVSPEPAEAFIADVLARVPEARRTDAPTGPHPAAPRDIVLGRFATATTVVGVVAFVVGLVVAEIPRGCVLKRDVIAIHRLLAGDVEIPLEEVLSVEPLPEEALRGARRVWARAWPWGLAGGEFRTDALGAYRMFASRPGSYVHVTAKFGRVVLTPDDPDRFVAELNQRLGH